MKRITIVRKPYEETPQIFLGNELIGHWEGDKVFVIGKADPIGEADTRGAVIQLIRKEFNV